MADIYDHAFEHNGRNLIIKAKLNSGEWLVRAYENDIRRGWVKLYPLGAKTN